MRERISVRVAVLDLRRAVSSQPRAVDGFSHALIEKMTGIADYLNEITEEYKSQYKRVSAIQHYTSEWDRDKARSAAKEQKPPIPEKMKTSMVCMAGASLRRVSASRMNVFRQTPAAPDTCRQEETECQ